VDTDPDNIAGLYERHAHEYAADRRNVGEGAWLDRFGALLAPGASVLDIGSGSGDPMARYLIDRGFAVDGVDTSPMLINLCRERFPIFKPHAAPGAALMFTSGASHGEAIGSYHGEPLYHASLAPEEYRTLLQSIGFRIIAHVVEDPNCGGCTVWLAQAEQ
jgi:SAM-dependent methyltransferase